MRKSEVELEIEAKEDLPPVLGDRDQLSQLFTNLIDNAIKYGGENSDVTMQRTSSKRRRRALAH